ncbi:hypothetical protein FPRO04_14597 [Fusarium proliferatum]|nr:hypothetical protein FPRO04_14597 [Fusarium proliferatum]
MEITESTPSVILERISQGFWTAEEVTEAFIQRAIVAQHLTNPISDAFFEQALERARSLDVAFKASGRVTGPLHGLVISVKDVIDLKGHATTIGYIGLADTKANKSAELLERIQEAGAILYCKTNVPQGLMSGECANFLYGRTVSPNNRDLSAGGSSGGEGSLVALGGSPLGIGTDIAGSIRTPANFNGIYGLCPSYGRLPIHDAENSAPSFINAVAGPMCRSIDGLRVYTQAVLSTEPHKYDAACVRLPWNDVEYNTIKGRSVAGGLTFGMVWHDGVVRPHPPIGRGMRETRAALRAAGHEVVDLDFFTGEENLEKHLMAVLNCDGGAAVRAKLDIVPEPAHPETVLPTPSEAISASELLSHGKSILVLRKHFLAKWQDTAHITKSGKPVDVLILPSGATVAPPHGTMNYYLYEAISNVLDWSCATIPVGRVNANLDPQPPQSQQFSAMSAKDQANWAEYNPDKYHNAPICLQVLGQRFSEERVIACLEVVEKALKDSRVRIQS